MLLNIHDLTSFSQFNTGNYKIADITKTYLNLTSTTLLRTLHYFSY